MNMYRIEVVLFTKGVLSMRLPIKFLPKDMCLTSNQQGSFFYYWNTKSFTFYKQDSAGPYYRKFPNIVFNHYDWDKGYFSLLNAKKRPSRFISLLKPILTFFSRA